MQVFTRHHYLAHPLSIDVVLLNTECITKRERAGELQTITMNRAAAFGTIVHIFNKRKVQCWLFYSNTNKAVTNVTANKNKIVQKLNKLCRNNVYPQLSRMIDV